MQPLKVTSKGALALKPDVVRHLGAQPGDHVQVELIPGGAVVLRVSSRHDMSALFGSLTPPEGAPALTVDEMSEIAADGWTGRR